MNPTWFLQILCLNYSKFQARSKSRHNVSIVSLLFYFWFSWYFSFLILEKGVISSIITIIVVRRSLPSVYRMGLLVLWGNFGPWHVSVKYAGRALITGDVRHSISVSVSVCSLHANVSLLDVLANLLLLVVHKRNSGQKGAPVWSLTCTLWCPNQCHLYFSPPSLSLSRMYFLLFPNAPPYLWLSLILLYICAWVGQMRDMWHDRSVWVASYWGGYYSLHLFVGFQYLPTG